MTESHWFNFFLIFYWSIVDAIVTLVSGIQQSDSPSLYVMLTTSITTICLYTTLL